MTDERDEKLTTDRRQRAQVFELLELLGGRTPELVAGNELTNLTAGWRRDDEAYIEGGGPVKGSPIYRRPDPKGGADFLLHWVSPPGAWMVGRMIPDAAIALVRTDEAAVRVADALIDTGIAYGSVNEFVPAEDVVPPDGWREDSQRFEVKADGTKAYAGQSVGETSWFKGPGDATDLQVSTHPRGGFQIALWVAGVATAIIRDPKVAFAIAPVLAEIGVL